MPFRLVQELEGHFTVIEELLAVWYRVEELEELGQKASKLGHDDIAHEAEEDARRAISTVEGSYSENITTIYWYLHVPIIVAIGTRLADCLLGPLQWTHTAAILLIVIISILVTRQRPSNPTTIVTLLSIMPREVSGSLTKLVGDFFCIYTLCPPFVMYAWQDISDRTQVRWILIGMLLDILYLATAALLGDVNFHRLSSVAFALVVLLVEFGLLYLGCRVIFTHGPWDPYFKVTYVGDTGRVIQHPVSRVLTASVRYTAQLILFRLNRLIGVLFLFTRPFEPSVRAKMIKDLNYTYSPLSGSRMIRLLKIHKGRPSQRVECSFEIHQLGDENEYEAISYVWGDDSPNSLTQIILNGCYFSITQNAFKIICKRRSMWMDKLIWIDQVCINQKDGAEKASQVKLMGQIYQDASLVVAYLGESENAYRVQNLFAELYFRMEGLGMTAESIYKHYSRQSATSRLDVVAEFFSNTWFQRVWIIQEAVFASRLRMIYGDTCIDWKYLCLVMEVLGHRQVLEAFGQPCTRRELFVNFLLGIRNVDTILELRGDIVMRETQLDLAHVLTLGNGFKSKLERDKVYALLDLIRDESKELIKPTYDKTIRDRDIYIDAMLVILERNTDPLRVLVRAGIGFPRSVTMVDLPSWVPDWSHSTHLQIVDKYYSAGMSHQAVVRVISKTKGIISLGGVRFDQVEHIADYNGDMTSGDTNMHAIARYMAAERMTVAYVADPYCNGQSRLEAFIRTLVGNQVSMEDDNLRSTDQYIAHYLAAKQWYEAINGLESLSEKLPGVTLESLIKGLPAGTFESLSQTLPEITLVNRFHHFAATASSKRRFCITRKGRMAIVPPESLVADVICVIKGARMPFVLRPVSDVGESRGYYRLVGCCYVHGVMDGELDLQKSESFLLI